MESESKQCKNYNELFTGEEIKKIGERLHELTKTAEEFIYTAGYEGLVECNERIMLNVLLDYYADIKRLKDFHGIEFVRTEKITAYTVSWIVHRKPLQFIKYPEIEKDIFVNERFAAYLLLNECIWSNEDEYISSENLPKLEEYTNLLLYYLKYRECNPQVLEIAIESFKLGKLVKHVQQS